MVERAKFGKLGVVFATAGSAVGLGNIWRFPYMAGTDGGAAFILIYLACVMILGVPAMIAEFIVGRHSSANAARAYRMLSGKKAWASVGYMGMLTSTVILGFYAVVAGWCLYYLYASVTMQVGGTTDQVATYFDTFSSSVSTPLLCAVGFLLLTHFVVVRGVRQGIEKASNILMPTLFVLLIVIVVASCMLPGAYRGVEFLFNPDFSKISGSVFLDALGQAFFSLSLGTACLCTYASYFSRQTNLLHSAVQIALLDSLIAILAGLMIFPAAFSVGVSPDSGPKLIFITLPTVFQQAFGNIPLLGYVISIMFYALLSLAALTSTISMHEIGTAFCQEELKLPRAKAAWIVTGACSVITVLSSLSVGACPGLKVFGMSFMDFCDYLTAQISLPLGGFLTCTLVGWYVSRKIVWKEYTNWGTLPSFTFRFWFFLVRVVCPVCIIAIFMHQFGLF